MLLSQGKKRLIILALILLSFLLVSIVYVNYKVKVLTKNEQKNKASSEQVLKKIYEGKVSYLGGTNLDNIKYVLTDLLGKDVILLKASDEKLTVVEGLRVKVSGVIGKTKDGKDYLLVEEVIVNSATN